MEVGAVKHQLNTEIIQLKKKLNQAKVQIIHKLTRKAKTFKLEKKCPDQLKAKLQRKADAAVSEVLLIKKVRPKDLIRFAITHKGKLQDYINKPTVDNDKAFAKILLHKAMAEKYKHLRDLYSNMPIDQLLMTRKERLQLKKKKKEKEKQEKCEENKNVIGNGDQEKDHDHCFNNKEDDVGSQSDEDFVSGSDDELGSLIENKQDSENQLSSVGEPDNDEQDDEQMNNNEEKSEGFGTVDQILRAKDKKENSKITQNSATEIAQSMPKQKLKKSNKKLNSKPRKKDIELQTPIEAKVVDSFFLTASGDHYMTLAEPRAPDEVKEEHVRGNRRLRRAEKFGKPIKKFVKKNLDLINRDVSNLSDHNRTDQTNTKLEPKKLHPSWEAKKQKSGIIQFQGKKVLFS